MATDITTDIWEFDATGEGDGSTGATTPTYNHPIYVKHVLFVDDGTNNGLFTVTNKNGGIVIAQFRTTAEVESAVVPVNDWVSGVYITALPTSGKVYVYTGK